MPVQADFAPCDAEIPFVMDFMFDIADAAQLCRDGGIAPGRVVVDVGVELLDLASMFPREGEYQPTVHAAGNRQGAGISLCNRANMGAGGFDGGGGFRGPVSAVAATSFNSLGVF